MSQQQQQQQQPISNSKVYNHDPNVKNRIRFASNKQRSTLASADVYRNYKRRIGIVTSSSNREELVHNNNNATTKKNDRTKKTKRFKSDHTTTTTVIISKKDYDSNTDYYTNFDDDNFSETGSQSGGGVRKMESQISLFGTELDILSDRNGSEIFKKFYHTIWVYCRSLPEVLHHSEIIIDLLLEYVVTQVPKINPTTTTTITNTTETEIIVPPNDEEKDVDELLDDDADNNNNIIIESTQSRDSYYYVVNHATTDLLHLLAVLARDIRHEIHPYVHSKIMPRILQDLLGPPPVFNVGVVIPPLDVVIVEAAFRTLSYIFRYDAEPLLSEGIVVPSGSSSTKDNNNNDDLGKDHTGGCLERMRQYYGTVLGNKRELIRRLGAESFASLIRKLKTDTMKRIHLKRILKALALSTSSTSIGSLNDNEQDHDSSNDTSSSSSLLVLPLLSSLPKVQQDAIDGVSYLLFEMARGVNGKLHTKGMVVVIQLLFNCFYDSKLIMKLNGKLTTSSHTQKNKKNNATNIMDQDPFISLPNHSGMMILYYITSTLMEHLCQHLQPTNTADIMSTMIESMKKNYHIQTSSSLSDSLQPKNQVTSVGFYYVCKIMQQLVQYKKGHIIRQKIQVLDELEELFDTLTQPQNYKSYHVHVQKEILHLLCTTGVALQEDDDFMDRMSMKIRGIVQASCEMIDFTTSTTGSSRINPTIHFLINHLLCQIPVETAMSTFGSVLLSIAAEMSLTKPIMTQQIIYGLACIQCKSIDNPDDKDDTFTLDSAVACNVTDDDNDTLLRTLLYDFHLQSPTSIELITKSVVCGQAASFIAVAGGDDKDSKRLVSNYKLVSTWILRLLDWIKTKTTYGTKATTGETDKSIIILMSITIECFARLTTLIYEQTKKSKLITPTLEKARLIVSDHLMLYSKNVWVLKSVATFSETLKLVTIELNDTRDEIFDILIPNLRASNHFVRLHTLTILASYPKLPFVVDNADIDFQDDLDDEGTSNPLVTTRNPLQQENSMTGSCHIIETLLGIETSPVSLEKERHLMSLVSRVEVLGRTGKLPMMYAEAASAHMIGLLHVKYAPVWPGAVKALVGLTKGHENSVWPNLVEQLRDRMNRFPYYEPTKHEMVMETNVEEKNVFSLDATKILDKMIRLEVSQGQDCALFEEDIASAVECGRISRHLIADDRVILESLWSVLENAPTLLRTHSRTIVPIFLHYMKLQYYALHRDDPDAREMPTEEFLCEEEEITNPNPLRTLNIRDIQNRLKCQLKTFASVNGPQQLFKHKLLLPIFVALVGHQDTDISRIAFSCILRFKPAYLLPVADTFKELFGKGTFRNAMMHFKSYTEGRTIDTKNRKHLISLLTRILFGRLSSRTAISKSSKDTPTSRRNAIVQCLSSVCEEENEVFPFIYLMGRVYLPTDFVRKPIEEQNESDQVRVLDNLTHVTPELCLTIPVQVHQGFLNVLEAVLSQFGHRIIKYIPTFMSILLSLCGAYEVKEIVKNETEVLSQEATEEADTLHENKEVRAGTIRTLCYRRLAEIFTKFAETVNLSLYSKSLWATLRRSLQLLPEMVINSDSVPALLSLLKTISSHPSLHKMLLDEDEAFPTVLKCLSESSKSAVVESVLSIIHNLIDSNDDGGVLTVRGESQKGGVGQDLIKTNIVLLLERFHSRISTSSVERIGRNHGKKHSSQGPNTLRRELRILCSVSDLVDFEGNMTSSNQVQIIESLCTLLLPFLDLASGTSDDDRIKVLELLDKLIVKVSEESAWRHFETLSILLGPLKGKQGMASKSVRKSIATLLHHTSRTNLIDAIPVSNVLVELCAVNERKVDEMDPDRVCLALNSLSESSMSNFWPKLCASKGKSDASLLLPLVHCSFHLLFSDDGVVSRGSFRALKQLLNCTSDNVDLSSDGLEVTNNESEDQSWMKLLQGSIVPSIRRGLSSSSTQARRFCILLLGDIARICSSSSNPNLYGDLSILLNEKDPDLDFFANITHVQIHRHSRAMQRLRKQLTVNVEGSVRCQFNMHSLSNILLPLATHPIYESKMKIEEKIALEAIATVGAISRHLTWGKYSNTLWTHLNQFDRHLEQEKYMIGLICAIIDGFHFDIQAGGESVECCVIWKTLEKRIIPKVQSLLMKEKVDKKGGKVKHLRSAVVLALVKLYNKFPMHLFKLKLPPLLTTICHALTNKDSNARDIARVTLAKMVLEIDISFLPDILRDLAITLHEGYKVHVLSATIHTILLELSAVYKPPESSSDPPKFDAAVPAFMDLIQKDIFGMAQERKDASAGSRVSHVKEAGGSKALHAIELLAAMIQFRPSMPLQQSNMSSVHALVMPLIERLRLPGLHTKAVRRIKECLSRASAGLLQNKSLQVDELLPFVHATLDMFVSRDEVRSFLDTIEEDADSDDENPLRPLRVSGAKNVTKDDSVSNKKTKMEVVEWRPSAINAATNAKEARLVQRMEERKLFHVRDGASAPKLTGTSRYRFSGIHMKVLNDPAIVSAVAFNLQLLSSVLKKQTKSFATSGVLDPFVPLLTTCVCSCRDSEVILLSMRCLGFLLRADLPSLRLCSKSLATKTLDFLTAAGSNQELTYASYKMMTFLIDFDREARSLDIVELPIEKRENALANCGTIPLNAEQMQVLLSFIQVSVVDSTHYNPAISLIKTIMSHRYMSAEFYDLMETALEQSVRSLIPSARDQFSKMFVHYLINYPLSIERIEQHLKQVVLNLSYEYAEGRESGIRLVNLLLEKLPEPMIEARSHLFYLPLSLQLVNDESKECRESVAKCLGCLLKRLSTDGLQGLYNFTVRWSKGKVELRRMALQLFSIFVDIRVDFMKRGDTFRNLLMIISDNLETYSDNWEVTYFALLLIEKSIIEFHQVVCDDEALWRSVMPTMTNTHPWVKLVSARLISISVTELDPKHGLKKNSNHYICKIAGSLHQIAKNICFQLGCDENEQNDELTATNAKSLTWIVQAMKSSPELCFPEDYIGDSDPVYWVMTRLSNIAKQKGTKRRISIFKCFAAFATLCSDVAFEYLELMLEPLHRSEAETSNMNTISTVIVKVRNDAAEISEESQLAKEVLNVLEDQCTNHEYFLLTYGKVKTNAREKKDKRKNELKTEALIDPVNAAKRRIDKQDQEKKRRKRRVDERRSSRGGTGKRRHFE